MEEVRLTPVENQQKFKRIHAVYAGTQDYLPNPSGGGVDYIQGKWNVAFDFSDLHPLPIKLEMAALSPRQLDSTIQKPSRQIAHLVQTSARRQRATGDCLRRPGASLLRPRSSLPPRWVLR
jgi:hypothetical protein